VGRRRPSRRCRAAGVELWERIGATAIGSALGPSPVADGCGAQERWPDGSDRWFRQSSPKRWLHQCSFRRTWESDCPPGTGGRNGLAVADASRLPPRNLERGCWPRDRGNGRPPNERRCIGARFTRTREAAPGRGPRKVRLARNHALPDGNQRTARVPAGIQVPRRGCVPAGTPSSGTHVSRRSGASRAPDREGVTRKPRAEADYMGGRPPLVHDRPRFLHPLVTPSRLPMLRRPCSTLRCIASVVVRRGANAGQGRMAERGLRFRGPGRSSTACRRQRLVLGRAVSGGDGRWLGR
jgi:hypothetical protein